MSTANTALTGMAAAVMAPALAAVALIGLVPLFFYMRNLREGASR